MILHNSDKQYFAICYDTVTFNALKYYMSIDGITLNRILPDELIQNPSNDKQYINLVVKDLDLRKQITGILDKYKLDRFSYVHPSSDITNVSVGRGVFINPNCTLYITAKILEDVLIHGNTLIAYNSTIGKGTVISPSVSIAGSSIIGEFCFLGIATTVIDNVTLGDNIVIGAHSLVAKNLTTPGKYVGAPVRQLP
jgi:UDP-3-O-[3-hydroxymyristoyl] glucosamine N-acyltransferase